MIKGDHLISSRSGYDHHGLYIGNREVIHYSGFSEVFDKGSIKITTLKEFEQGSGSKVKNHLVSLYDLEERVDRAFSKVGENSYNLIFNNCEHFVNWCFNGLKTSFQVNNVAASTATIINGYVNEKAAVTAVVAFAKQVTKLTATKTAEKAIVSATAKSIGVTTASTVVGLTAASAVTGSTVAGIVGVVGAGVVAPFAGSAAVVVGAGYGVKKIFDWVFD